MCVFAVISFSYFISHVVFVLSFLTFFELQKRMISLGQMILVEISSLTLQTRKTGGPVILHPEPNSKGLFDMGKRSHMQLNRFMVSVGSSFQLTLKKQWRT